MQLYLIIKILFVVHVCRVVAFSLFLAPNAVEMYICYPCVLINCTIIPWVCWIIKHQWHVHLYDLQHVHSYNIVHLDIVYGDQQSIIINWLQQNCRLVDEMHYMASLGLTPIWPTSYGWIWIMECHPYGSMVTGVTTCCVVTTPLHHDACSSLLSTD